MPSIVIADDATEVRDLLRIMLETFGGFEVVAEAVDGRAAILATMAHHPDVVVLDLAMPTLGGLEALPFIRHTSPETAVVIYSTFDPRMFAPLAKAKGAYTYIQKGRPLYEVHELLLEACAA